MVRTQAVAIVQIFSNEIHSMQADILLGSISWEACVQAKATKKPATGSFVKNSKSMVVHKDLCGRFKQSTVGGKMIFVTFTAVPHRCPNIKLIKSQCAGHLHCKCSIQCLERKAGQKVEKVRSGNAGKVLDMKQNLKENCTLLGICTP